MVDLDLNNFLGQYFDEAKDRLRCINQCLVLFESGDIDDAQLTLLRRQAHTIKGAAQMLGIKDMSDTAHLFEDVMEHMIQHPDSRTQPMIQFLFDLHDQLEKRLEHPDRGAWLDAVPLKERFRQLQYDLVQLQKNTTDGNDVYAKDIGNIRQRNKCRAQGQSNNHLIADIMGAIEESTDSGASRSADGILLPVELSAGVLSDHADNFRPGVSRLELERDEQQEGSGHYLRVDRERISYLSNQIIELSSDRYRIDSMEEKFEAILSDLRQLNHIMQKFEANIQGNWDAVKRARVAGKVRIALEHQLRQTQLLGEELRHNQSRSSIMLDDVRVQVLALMLRPLNSIFSVFPRTVRDIAVRCEKKVQLLVAGESVEMDQVVAEALVEPLIHLINNAVAHGIERPEGRLRCGKPVEGQVTILARQKGSDIQIEIIDDGQGIDVEQIRDLAIARDIITQTEADGMDSAAILELLFHSGFTTQQTVNDISGRGMGLNVVHNAVCKLTGSIHIHSVKGQGTRFTLSLPVSIAVQQARIFRIADQRFGMLVNVIEAILPLDSQSIENGPDPCNREYINYKNHQAPIIDLRQTLRQMADSDRRLRDRRLRDADVLVVEHMEGYLGIVVDKVFDPVEVIVHALDPYLKRYQPVGVMGNTIIADGSVLLLIDPDGIMEMWRTAPDIIEPGRQPWPAGQTFDQRVMLVDDSLIALQLEKRMLESFGLQVDTAIGGTDALEKIRLRDYDLLITDLDMPRLNGFDLIRQLRAEQRYEALPVLVIAACDSYGDQQRAKEAGADACLAKQGMNSDELLRALQSLLVCHSMKK